MRRSTISLVLVAAATLWGSPAAHAQQKDPLGGVVRAITALFAPAAVREIDDGPSIPEDATHEQVKAISIKGEGGASLQTLTCSPEGRVVALLGPPRYGRVAGGQSKPTSEVRVLDADGNELAKWPLAFAGQSVAVGPGGLIYVAGEGRLAKFDQQGKSLGETEVPHLAKVLNDKAKLRQQAEQQLKQQIESFESSKQQFETQLKTIQDKEPSNRTPIERAQLESLKANVKQYEQISEQYKKQTVEQVMEQVTSRLRMINGVTVTDKEVFIACGELKGYGYAIWRMGLDFQDPVQVLSQIGGCCGQMDIQAQGNNLFVAENTRHRVGQYDREGKLVQTFGKKSRDSEGDCFGGCCNPMNCRIGSGGEIYTAESEGVVKKWSAKGEFLATVGVAKLTGGCKNVAVAASPQGDKVYFCDLPGSRIIVLGKKAPPKPAAGD